MSPFSLKSKIALGTVQLGLSYGINNSTGKPDRATAFDILDLANASGIQVLDSAEAYGDSLDVIGQYITAKGGNSFKVVSKFIVDHAPIEEKVTKQLTSLAIPQLYGYMYHRFADYEAGVCRDELIRLKASKQVTKIGVSVYGVDQLRKVVHDSIIDLIQVPFNAFDAGEEKKELLRQAKFNGQEVHVRSVFLQGLFFRKPESLTGNLKSFFGSLTQFQLLLRQSGLTAMQVCLNYAMHQEFIDYVVIGVETPEQLEQNLASVLTHFPDEIKEQFESIPVADQRLLNPGNWKP